MEGKLNEFEDAKIINDKFEEFKKKGIPKILGNLTFLIAFFIIIYLLSGFFIVQQYEVGVIRRFGKLNRIVQPGLRYHIPFPVESVVKPKIQEIKRIEIGYRTISYYNQKAQYRDVPEESLMLTGDTNIVNADFMVQYKISNPANYVFNVANIEDTIKKVAEATMRQIAANHTIDDILTEKKDQIQIEARTLLQKTLDSYKAGVHIQTLQLQDVVPPKEVASAFKDVASAKEDKEKYINEALGYSNEKVPKAEGEASQIINAAEAYKQEKINLALGQVNKFNAILKEYTKAPRITRIRLFLETAEDVLSRTKKLISGEHNSSSLLKFFQLNSEGGK